MMVKSMKIFSKRPIRLKFNENNFDKLKFENSGSNFSKTFNNDNHMESPNKIKTLDLNNQKKINNTNNRDNLNFVHVFSSNISGRNDDSKNKSSKNEKNNALIMQNLKKKEKKTHFNIDCKDFINLYIMQFVTKNTSIKENLKRQKILFHVQEKISQYLNLEKIIEKFENIEIIKKILFDKYQRNILDIISIPTLDLGNSDEIKDKKTIFKKVKNKDNKERFYYERKLSSDDNKKKIGLFLENYEERLNNKMDEKIFQILLE